MANSTSIAQSKKPAKPHKDWPLTAHRNRQWCKKVRGKIHYFGGWDDPQAALSEWLRVKDDLLAGREARPQTGGFTVGDICNAFLEFCDGKLNESDPDARTLEQRTFNEYKAACKAIIKAFGRGRAADDIRPIDFGKLRKQLAARKDGTGTKAPKTIEGLVARCKVVINFANANELVDKPIQYGQYFDKPPAKAIKRHKKRQAHKGEMDFTAKQIRDLLKVACPQLKAMVLLATNCGVGNADLGRMTVHDVDLENGWLDYARHKTEVDRRAKLWPETVLAIESVLDDRKEPKNPDLADLIFVTRIGQGWYKADSTTNPISQAFRKLLKETDHYTKGVGFYGLRRSFSTVAAETEDQPAIDLVMGHEGPEMSALYRQRLGDKRLEKVATHVRKWLFGKRGAK